MTSPSRHIVFTTDAGYSNQTIVAASSLLHNLIVQECSVTIICDQVSAYFSRQIRWLGRQFPCSSIQLVEAKEHQITSAYYVRDHLTSATYYRFFIDRLLPATVERVLYLDSDIIVNGSVDSLFNLDFGNKIVAAVPETGSQDDLDRLSLPSDPGYFNAGVMLIDLQAWRQQRISDRLFEICSNRPSNLQWPSQDPLNLILRDEWTPLSPIYNYNHGYNDLIPARKAVPKPVIIHYSGTPKPWNLGGLSLEALPFWTFVFRTPSWRWFVARVLHSLICYPASFIGFIRQAGSS